MSCKVLILVFLWMVSTGQSSEIIVTPAPNSTNCSCFTLTECAQRQLSSYTTLTFLDGYHTLDSDFTMSSLTNVSLRAAPGASVTIDCRGQTGFIFRNLTALIIKNIAFSTCGYYNGSFNPGALFHSVKDSEVINITLNNGDSTVTHIVESNINFTDLHMLNNRISTDTNGIRKVLFQLISSRIDLHGTIIISNNTISYNNESISNIISAIFFASEGSKVHINGQLLVQENYCPTGIVLFEGGVHEINGNVNFSGNGVMTNGSFALQNANLTCNGEFIFALNSGSFFVPDTDNLFSASNSSLTGGLLLVDSTMDIVGSILFMNNSGSTTSLLMNNSVLLLDGTLVNKDNPPHTSEPAHSTVFVRNHSSFEVTGNCTFINNKATSATLRVQNSVMRCSGSNTFTGNTGCNSVVARSATFELAGTTVFRSNSGVLSATSSAVMFSGSSSFIENNERGCTYYQGAISSTNGGSIEFKGSFIFQENTMNSDIVDGGALYADNRVIFDGSGKFYNNRAHYGGALFLQNRVKLVVSDNTSLLFQGNRASKGASIYLSRIQRSRTCNYGNFVTLPCLLRVDGSNSTVLFVNNSAGNGGSVLHIDFFSNGSSSSVLDFPFFQTLRQENNTSPTLATDNFMLCFCIDHEANCTIREMEYKVTRGREFVVSLASITLFNNNNTQFVNSFVSNSNTGYLKNTPQNVSEKCTNITYTIFSSADNEVVVTTAANDKFSIDGPRTISFKVTFKDCPEGFVFEGDRCVCHEHLTKLATCNINTGGIDKIRNIWIGAHCDNHFRFLGLKLHHICPFHYCKPPSAGSVVLSNPDTQCRNNRSGVLCGGCRANFSLKIGAVGCWDDCSDNAYLAVLIPMAVLGICVLVFLFISQLTISTGAINGLIFYVNVVSINRFILRLDEVRVLSVFVEWLNLNFGISTCFHSNLNRLQYQAWQFVFPFYLLFLELIIIIVCRYSIKASKLAARSNPVPTLSTLVLLCYNKCLQTATESLFIANIEFPPNATDVVRSVWRLDGTVAYGRNWHGVLVFFSIVVLFVIALFALLLFASQWMHKSESLSKCLNRCYLTNWFNSFQAPLKPGCRYWIGFCLILRYILLIPFPFIDDSARLRLLATGTICIVMLTMIATAGGIYTKFWLNLLEGSFIANLAILSLATYHDLSVEPDNQNILSHISIGIAFLTFLMIIIVYTVSRCIRKVKRGREQTESIESTESRRRPWTITFVKRDNATKQSIELDRYHLQYRDSIISTPD